MHKSVLDAHDDAETSVHKTNLLGTAHSLFPCCGSTSHGLAQGNCTPELKTQHILQHAGSK